MTEVTTMNFWRVIFWIDIAAIVAVAWAYRRVDKDIHDNET